MTNLTILNNQISTFENLYSLNDLHKASGAEKKHQPYLFMRLDQTKDLIAEMDKESSPQICGVVKTINGGNNKGTYACKELVIAYAMWISPKFHLVVLRAFLEMYEQPQLEEPKATPAQKQTIKNAVHQATIRTGRTHQNIWNVAHTHFGINEIAELKAKDYYSYLDFVENMQPKVLPVQNLNEETLNIIIKLYGYCCQAQEMREKIHNSHLRSQIDNHIGGHYLHNFGIPLKQTLEKAKVHINENAERLMIIQATQNLLNP